MFEIIDVDEKIPGEVAVSVRKAGRVVLREGPQELQFEMVYIKVRLVTGSNNYIVDYICVNIQWV